MLIFLIALSIKIIVYEHFLLEYLISDDLSCIEFTKYTDLFL